MGGPILTKGPKTLDAKLYGRVDFKTSRGEGRGQRNIRTATNKVIGGSAMPLRGIILSLSKIPINYVTVLLFTPVYVHLHKAHILVVE